MRVLLRYLATAALAVPYALGWLVGLVVVTALMVAASARLGWTDARRKGRHGAA
jgi:hypothetical protein